MNSLIRLASNLFWIVLALPVMAVIALLTAGITLWRAWVAGKEAPMFSLPMMSPGIPEPVDQASMVKAVEVHTGKRVVDSYFENGALICVLGGTVKSVDLDFTFAGEDIDNGLAD